MLSNGIARMSRLGFGAHRLSNEQHVLALRHALESGCRVIDTSPNYCGGESETMVGGAVRAFLDSAKGCSRDELTVITKVGVLQGADLHDAKLREASGRPWPGVVKLSPEAWFCISPEHVAHSVSASTERLGMAPDVVLLHNPEFILADELARSRRDRTRARTTSAAMPAASFRDSFYDRIGASLAALTQCHSGRIGVSSNIEGCRYSVSGRRNDHHESVDLQRVRAAARASCGDEAAARVSVVQIPLNLLEPDAAIVRAYGGGAAGVTAGGVTAGGVTACGLAAGTEAEVGVGGEEEGGIDHRRHATPRLTPAARAQSLGFSVVSHRPIHAIPPAPSLARGFGVGPARHMSLRDATPMPPTSALIRNVARDVLAPFLGPGAHTLTLRDIAMLFALHAPDVDCVLSGVRTVEYVDHALSLLGGEEHALSAEAHAALAEAMSALVDELHGQEVG